MQLYKANSKKINYKIQSLFNILEWLEPVIALLHLLPNNLSCISCLQRFPLESKSKGPS